MRVPINEKRRRNSEWDPTSRIPKNRSPGPKHKPVTYEYKIEYVVDEWNKHVEAAERESKKERRARQRAEREAFEREERERIEALDELKSL